MSNNHNFTDKTNSLWSIADILGDSFRCSISTCSGCSLEEIKAKIQTSQKEINELLEGLFWWPWLKLHTELLIMAILRWILS